MDFALNGPASNAGPLAFRELRQGCGLAAGSNPRDILWKEAPLGGLQTCT
jgi:hypothetical protein